MQVMEDLDNINISDIDIVVPQVAICPNLKFQFRAIQFEISNWGNLILLPQFKIGVNFNFGPMVPQVGHCPNFKLGQIFNVGPMVPKLSIAPILNWANFNVGPLVPQVEHCPNFKLGQILMLDRTYGAPN